MGKALKSSYESFDRKSFYSLEDAVSKVKEFSKERFDSSVDVSIKTNFDHKKADQNIRGVVQLPEGLGKKSRILVFTSGDSAKQAKDAGADFVGLEEFVQKIKGGWSEFDKCIATPDVMSDISVLGRILGPKGLMPNPKTGTVTFDVAQAVEMARMGQMEYRLDKGGVIHGSFGRVAFSESSLVSNLKAVLLEIFKSKPSSMKGEVFSSIFVSSTMGPGVGVSLRDLKGLFKES
jgi:large subunit ribosomal protein L1